MLSKRQIIILISTMSVFVVLGIVNFVVSRKSSAISELEIPQSTKDFFKRIPEVLRMQVRKHRFHPHHLYFYHHCC